MSNTFNTNKARIVRKLNKEAIEKFNAGTGDTQIINDQINKLEIDAKRYGNHRAMKAKEKVTERRKERHDLNQEVQVEIKSVMKKKF